MTTDAAPRMPIAAPLAGAVSYAPVVLVALGVSLLTVSAKMQIPLWPVPMTMQTYVILVIAMAYGTRLGVATVMAYLIAGAINSQFFAATLAARTEYAPVALRNQVFVWIEALKITAGSAGTAVAGALTDLGRFAPLLAASAVIGAAVTVAVVDARRRPAVHRVERLDYQES